MVNWDRIFELREEVGEDDLSEVLQLFCEEVEEVLAELSNAEQTTMKRHLHFLKGSALNIGLEGVSALCREEEEKLKSAPDANVRIDAIRDSYQTSKSELADLF